MQSLILLYTIFNLNYCLCSSPLLGAVRRKNPRPLLYKTIFKLLQLSPFVYSEPYQAVLSIHNCLPNILSISPLPYLLPAKPVLFYRCSNKVHAIKAYRVVEVQLRLFITSSLDGTGWLDQQTGLFVPGNYLFVLAEQEALWTPESVQMFWRRDKFLAAAGVRSPYRQTRSIFTMLTRLQIILIILGEIRFDITLFNQHTN